MSNQFKIYASPDLNAAVSGEPGQHEFMPIKIGQASSLEIGAMTALTWVCQKGFTGSLKSPYAANGKTFICNVWEFKAPSGERWYIAIHQKLEVPINQETQPLSPILQEAVHRQARAMEEETDALFSLMANRSWEMMPDLVALEKIIKASINDHLESLLDELLTRVNGS